MQRALYSSFLLLASCFVFGQYNDHLSYGVKIGGLHSSVTNVPEMLLGREHQLVQFTLKEKGSYGIEGGLFFNYKFPDSRMAIQPELLYRKAGTEVHYNNDLSKEQYKLSFHYQYLVLGATYKFYPYEGVNLGLGAYYSKNLSPNAIEYTSNTSIGNIDTSYRQFYRDAIRGKDDFNLSFSLGYEFKEYLHLDIRYHLGIADVMESKSSSFQFVENANRSSLITLSLGYSFHTW